MYGDETVDRSTVNRLTIKFPASEAGKAFIEDEPRSDGPVSVTDENRRK